MCNPFSGIYANEERWLENAYHCEDCNESWTDYWYCEVDDDCPGCGVTYTPESSELLLVNGDLEQEPVSA